jgi:hypothetical protein
MQPPRIEPRSARASRRGALDLLAFVESALKLAGCFAIATLLGLSVVFAFTRLDAPQSRSASVLTRQARAESEILVLDRALRLWAAAHGGKYPAALAELVQPGNALDLPRTILIDPWKRPYRFVASEDPEEAPTISSLGLDGLEGGDGESLDLDNSKLDEPGDDNGLREAVQVLKSIEGMLDARTNDKERGPKAPKRPPVPRDPNQHP